MLRLYFKLMNYFSPFAYLCRNNKGLNNEQTHESNKKEMLEEKCIKQTWLAEELGKSFYIVNTYVCNRRQPSLEVLFEIAKILRVDPKDLINYK